jgi:hypothetical protein
MMSSSEKDAIGIIDVITNVGSSALSILVAKSTFEGTFSCSQARKVVDIPHREEKHDLFCGIFPYFLSSPPVSLSVLNCAIGIS